MRIRRGYRLDSRRARQKATRRRNSADKRPARARRDARAAAMLGEQLKAGKQLSPLVQSWVAVQLGRPARRASQDELAELAGRF